jgi:hypothetical protein
LCELRKNISYHLVMYFPRKQFSKAPRRPFFLTTHHAPPTWWTIPNCSLPNSFLTTPHFLLSIYIATIVATTSTAHHPSQLTHPPCKTCGLCASPISQGTPSPTPEPWITKTSEIRVMGESSVCTQTPQRRFGVAFCWALHENPEHQNVENYKFACLKCPDLRNTKNYVAVKYYLHIKKFKNAA